MPQQTVCHIKRPPTPGVTNRENPALCGDSAPGACYVKLGRDEQIPGTEFPVCIPCAERHIREHYEAARPAGA